MQEQLVSDGGKKSNQRNVNDSNTARNHAERWLKYLHYTIEVNVMTEQHPKPDIQTT
jgi:hypothetical protein